MHLHQFEDFPSVEAVKQKVLECTLSRPDYIVLVGDCVTQPDTELDWYLPAPNTDQGFSGDFLYGDLDGDGSGEVAVGRIPARTAEALQSYLNKVAKYEELPLCNNRIVLWAGAPKMQPVLNVALHQSPLLKDFGALVTITPLDQKQKSAFTDAISQPTSLSVVISHGTPFTVSTEGKSGHLSIDDLKYFNSPQPSGPMFILACQTGTFNIEGLCLAEALLANPGGPVAVVASSKVVKPLTNYLYAKSLASALNHVKQSVISVGELHAAVGEVFVAQLSHIDEDDEAVKLIRTVSTTTSIRVMDDYRSYSLLGDPTIPFSLL